MHVIEYDESLVLRVCVFLIEIGAGPAEAGKDFCEAFDIVIGEGFDLLAIDQFRRAILVQFDHTDGKELHDFAGIVLVRHAARCRIALFVAPVGEVARHGAGIGHFLQEVTEVAEGILRQHVHVIGNLRRCVVGGVIRDDEQLGQGKQHAGAQLVIAGNHVVPEYIAMLVTVDILATIPAGEQVTQVERRRLVDFSLQPVFRISPDERHDA